MSSRCCVNYFALGSMTGRWSDFNWYSRILKFSAHRRQLVVLSLYSLNCRCSSCFPPFLSKNRKLSITWPFFLAGLGVVIMSCACSLHVTEAGLIFWQLCRSHSLWEHCAIVSSSPVHLMSSNQKSLVPRPKALGLGESNHRELRRVSRLKRNYCRRLVFTGVHNQCLKKAKKLCYFTWQIERSTKLCLGI